MKKTFVFVTTFFAVLLHSPSGLGALVFEDDLDTPIEETQETPAPEPEVVELSQEDDLELRVMLRERERQQILEEDGDGL